MEEEEVKAEPVQVSNPVNKAAVETAKVSNVSLIFNAILLISFGFYSSADVICRRIGKKKRGNEK